jgi:hypothetical protein
MTSSTSKLDTSQTSENLYISFKKEDSLFSPEEKCLLLKICFLLLQANGDFPNGRLVFQ